MRFRYGAVPDDVNFQPEAEGGWSGIRDLGPIALQLGAIPVAVLIVAVLFGLLVVGLPRGVYPANQLTLRIPFWQSVLIVVGLLPVHELLHALCTPGWGRSPNTVIGLWPSKFLLYAYYQGEMSRNRFLLTLLAPFSLLSLAPLAIIASFRTVPLSMDLLVPLILLSLLNGIASSGDILGFGLVVTQIPASAIIRNKAWETFWRAAKP
jgi:hypothetical protein